MAESGTPDFTKANGECFVHEPLELDRKTIRVVRVLPNKNRFEISCSIQEIPLEDHHVCLSYTWGAEADSKIIELNGKPFAVRKNLWDFLQVARLDYSDQHLWIDALSIDQANVLERNHQVQQMAEIYSKAKYVLVWVGRQSPDLRLIELLWRYSYLYRLDRIPSRLGIATAVLLVFKGALNRLAHAPYFRRAWTVQELHLAKDGRIIVGRHFVRWSYLRDIYAKLYMHRRSGLLRTYGIWQHSIYEDHAPLESLEGVLLAYADVDCSDRRDKVYAMMGLVRQHDRIEVDYNQDVFWVLLKSVQTMSKRSTKIEDLFSNTRTLGARLRMWTLLYCVHWLQQNVSQAPQHIKDKAEPLGEPSLCCAFLLLGVDLDSKSSASFKAQYPRHHHGGTRRMVCSQCKHDHRYYQSWHVQANETRSCVDAPAYKYAWLSRYVRASSPKQHSPMRGLPCLPASVFEWLLEMNAQTKDNS